MADRIDAVTMTATCIRGRFILNLLITASAELRARHLMTHRAVCVTIPHWDSYDLPRTLKSQLYLTCTEACSHSPRRTLIGIHRWSAAREFQIVPSGPKASNACGHSENDDRQKAMYPCIIGTQPVIP